MNRSARLRRPLATLFAAAAAWLALLALRPGPPPVVRVLAAARDLPAGATLTPSDVRPVSLPPDAVPSGALRSGAAGRVLAGPMRRGEPLTDARVIGDRLLRGYGPDKVATPIRVADADTVRLVRPGARIDVLAAPPGSSSGEPPFTPTHRTAHDRPPLPTRPAYAVAPGRGAAGVPPPDPVQRGVPGGRGGRGGGYDRPAGTPWDTARVVASAVPVIAVPPPPEKGTREGALLVLATNKSQALALAGTRTDLSVTITT